jgi:hypothetical protein
MAPRPTQLYPGGPVRLFSTTRFQGQGSIPYSDGKRKGFIGLYLCTACGGPTLRVLAGANQWRCLLCVTRCGWGAGARRRDLERLAAARVVSAFEKARQEYGEEEDE